VTGSQPERAGSSLPGQRKQLEVTYSWSILNTCRGANDVDLMVDPPPLQVNA
jgi:hypothetical protein